MRVDARIATPATAPASGARRSGATSGFSLEGAGSGAPANAAAQTGLLAGVDALLTLQAGDDTPQERRRRSAKRGQDLLDGLDRLKATLLVGRVPASELRAIAGRLAERAGSSGDPRLDDILAQIELRAAVELAKLEMSRGV